MLPSQQCQSTEGFEWDIHLKSVNQYSLCPAFGSVVAVCRAVRRGGCCAGSRSWWSRRDLRRKRERNRNSSSARSNDVCTAKRWLKSNRSTYVGATVTACLCSLQGRPQDFGYGGQCPLATWGEENLENLTTKWCILKYIWINMWSAENCFFACFCFLIFH